MKFCMHLSTRIQDKRNELPLINCMTDLALEADAGGFDAISLTEHHLHENQGYQNSLLFACALAPRLTQATLNLLLNALEAAGDNGEVVVRLRQSSENVEIEVQDSGPGLTVEQQQHIFEAFYTTKPNGTGLGLAVSRQLVLEMGGDLRYQPEVGRKAFVISLRAVSRA